MQKTNYFELLEELSLLCSRAVFLAVNSTRAIIQKALAECTELQEQSTKKICELELALFTDFLPPLERQSIAKAAHGMSSVIEKCSHIIFQKTQRTGYDKRAKAPDACITLSQMLEESVRLLKKIKKPNQTPRLNEFRETLNASRKASRVSQKRQGAYSLLLCELREELSDCFDKVIEIMLCNI